MVKCQHNHDILLHKVVEGLPSDQNLCEMANLFKLFSDETRMKILYSLFESEMCVCAIAELLNKSQSVVSHSLRVLKDGKLVDCRRDGKTIYYYLADDHVSTIIGQGYEHIMEDK